MSVLLLVAAVLAWPGRSLPATARGRRPRRERPRPVDAAALAERFAAALDAGLSPAQGTAVVAGGEVPDVEGWWVTRAPAVARALAVSGRLGSPTAAAVRAAAQATRARADADRDLRSGLAGVRATAWLLTALPVLGALGALALAPPPPGARGAVALAVTAGALLTLGGWAWLRRLVRGAATVATT